MPFGGEGKLASSSRGRDLDAPSAWVEVLRLAGIGMAAAGSIAIDANVNDVETCFWLWGNTWTWEGGEDREREESAAAAVCSDVAL